MSTVTSYPLPKERTEQKIPDLKPLLTEAQAVQEAQRCLYCFDAPCIQACPTRINIPEFIKAIASGNYRSSAYTILSANILGLSCARVCPVEVLCAGACVYNHKGEEAIMIGRLQQFATEWAYQKQIQFFSRGEGPSAHPSDGKKVALVGAGPASLACAAELAILGHFPVIFEERPLPGGLNTSGVAPYKMHAETSLMEVEYIRKIGVEIQTDAPVGATASSQKRGKTFPELEKEFDAIFLGVGLGKDTPLKIPGEEMQGYVGSVDLIEQINLSTFSTDGLSSAVVIGGGNTAIDAAREMAKLGVPKVTMVYRRSQDEMTGYRHELLGARKDGVEVLFLASPIELLGDPCRGSKKVKGLRCMRMKLGEPDRSGRRKPLPLKGSEFEIPAELVVFATGQENRVKLLEQVSGLTLQDGLVVINPETMQTSNPRYFAGGDCVSGGQEVVYAARDGKKAACGIDRYLRQR